LGRRRGPKESPLKGGESEDATGLDGRGKKNLVSSEEGKKIVRKYLLQGVVGNIKENAKVSGLPLKTVFLKRICPRRRKRMRTSTKNMRGSREGGGEEQQFFVKGIPPGKKKW